jgi:hypothetical protein
MLGGLGFDRPEGCGMALIMLDPGWLARSV